AVAGRAGAVIPRLLVDAVGAEHLQVRVDGLDVLPELGRALAGDRTDEDDIRAGALDLLRERVEVGRLRVVALGRAVRAHDRAADLAEVERPGAADALAVGLAVIDDVGLLEALRESPLGRGATLVVVRVDVPRVVAVAARIVGIRLALRGDAVDRV